MMVSNHITAWCHSPEDCDLYQGRVQRQTLMVMVLEDNVKIKMDIKETGCENERG